MSKRRNNDLSLLKGNKQKLSGDKELSKQIEDLDDLARAIGIDNDSFSFDKLKVPYVTADPIYGAPWK